MKRCAALLALILAGCGDEPTSIHKWETIYTNESTGSQWHQFVISNPPKGQGALVELIRGYLKKSPPPGFWDGKYGAAFYRESSVTPIDEKQRPEASWWDQSRDIPYIKFKPIDDQGVASVRYVKKDNVLRIFFEGEYRLTCASTKFNIVDVKPDGSHVPTCN